MQNSTTNFIKKMSAFNGDGNYELFRRFNQFSINKDGLLFK